MDLMDYRRKIIMSSPHLSHAEGAVASFADGTDLPMKSLIVNIDPVQSGTGDPSPSNIRPISGWNGVKVTRTGKNLCIMTGRGYISGSTYRVDNASESMLFYAVKGQTYHVSASVALQRSQIGQLTSGNDISVNQSLTQVVKIDGTYTWTATWSGYTVWYIYPTKNETVEASAQIELGSTASDFEPYTGQNITISLGRTVYGGTLNVLTGELVADMAIVDLGTFSWNYATDNQYPVFYANKNNFGTALPDYTNGAITVVCSTLKAVTNKAFAYFANGSTSEDFSVAISATGTVQRVLIRDSRYTDTASFKTAMNGQTLVYKLATPLTYYLDPQTVRSLVGQNNIFADTGNTSLEYWAHP